LIQDQPECSYADSRDLAKIVAMDHVVFNEYDWISEEIFESWIARNRRVFRVLKLGPDKVAGYYSLLPLKKPILQKFINGDLHEKRIQPDDLYAEAESAQFVSLYFFSLVMDQDHRLLTKTMLEDAFREIEEYRVKNGVQMLYATSATPEGKRLLERLGFKQISDSGKREDHHSLHVLSLLDIPDLVAYFHHCV
jgi:hypothetical protein